MFADDALEKLEEKLDLTNSTNEEIKMSLDNLSTMFNVIKVHENKKKTSCMVPYSKLIESTLKVILEHGYIQSYEYFDDGKGGKYKIELNGKINNCSSIKPRIPVKKINWIQTEAKYLPAVGVGLIIVSTSKGVITNDEAKKQGVGGKLIAYIY